ncbi:hypothetical protein AHAS_Ahas01G0127500 [Arachis hypogaea]
MVTIKQRLKCMKTHIIRYLASNDHHNKQRSKWIMKMLKVQNPGPEELDTSDKEIEGPTDQESREEYDASVLRTVLKLSVGGLHHQIYLCLFYL